MRRESKTANERVNFSRVQGYHERTNSNMAYNSENYAFQGYTSNKYFTSDRYIELDDHFNRPDGKPLKGYGLEIETECNSIIDNTVYANLLEKVVFKTFPDGLFKMQHDGSLGGETNAECITQVMTKEFVRNHYKDFKTMWNDYFKAFSITTQNSNCGMHVNVSNALLGTSAKVQEDNAKKIYYLINKHFDFFKVALNRKNSTTYCSQCSDYRLAKDTPIEDLRGQSHGNSMNMSHFNAGRIEIRLVGGQKDFACFRNTMETIFHIVDNVKTLKWSDLDDLTKVFSGCNNYVFDRISTNCLQANVITMSDVEKIRATVKAVRYL